ncbi:MAG: hypothetical protein ABFS18_06075 [Thermodesulfobacteriota bacterium]
MFKKIRITILLVILVIVAGNAWLTALRTTDWDVFLSVVVYPVNGDGNEKTSSYIASLDQEVFKPVADIMASEGKRYQLELSEPVHVDLAPEVTQLPPSAPFQGGVFAVMLWSLKMRWWAWRVDTYEDPTDIRIFVLYYDPAVYKELGHSLGLKEGLLCLVKAYADYSLAPRNNVIIAHEMLHTLGATDKYEARTEQPYFPAGYAEPDLDPLYPQERAEIMGGLIPVSADRGRMPAGLDYAVIGPVTAEEIGWID